MASGIASETGFVTAWAAAGTPAARLLNPTAAAPSPADFKKSRLEISIFEFSLIYDADMAYGFQ
jgi:hypothetical protein